MFKEKHRIFRLLPIGIMLSLFALFLAKGEEPLRYSQDDTTIKGLLEKVQGKPGGYGVRVAENIVGKWVPMQKEGRTSSDKFLLNTNVTWKSLQFSNGLVDISYELANEGKEHRFVGIYEVIHKATEGRGNAPNIVIRSGDATENRVGVLVGVRIGEFSWFPADFTVLWFCDPDGNNYVFVPFAITSNELRRRMGDISPEEQEKTRKREMEALELKNKRITNPQTTSQAIHNLQNAKLTEHERNKEILRLMNEGDETCVPVLLEHIGANHSLVVRQNAIRALGAIRDKRAISPLIDLLRAPVGGNIEDEAEDEAILRRKAVIALGDIGDPATLPELKAIVQSERDYQSVRVLARITANQLEHK